MKTLTPEELKEILANHTKWLRGGPSGAPADLREADLSRADLRNANLSGANLSRADLSRADLSRADLRSAYLSGAYLSGANLSGASLRSAHLSGANLSGADLSGADLSGAVLPGFQIPQEGELIVWKKLRGGVLAKLRILPDTPRTGSLVGRKCRAQSALVLEGSGVSRHDGVTSYAPGSIVSADNYNDDVRIECAPGIHFFLSREEAEAY